MMRSTLEAIPQTFYSGGFYQRLLRQGQGIGIAFILLLTLIEIAVGAISLVPLMYKALPKLPDFAATLPVATFKDKKLSIDRPSPFVISIPLGKDKSSNDETVKIIVDTDYTVTDLNALMARMKSEKIALFFTAEQMITMQDRQGQVRVTNYNLTNTVITHDDWMHYAAIGQIALPLFLLFFLALGMFIAIFMKILFGGLIALIIGLFTKTVPGYGAAMRLAAAADVPPVIISAVFMLCHVIKFVSLGTFIIWIVYMIFGAVSAQSPEQKPTP